MVDEITGVVCEREIDSREGARDWWHRLVGEVLT